MNFRMQTLEVLWFVKNQHWYKAQYIPEDVAWSFIALMQSKGYTFCPEGSSSLEYCPKTEV